MELEITCALNSSSDSPEHARIAEQLGYARAWFYDSPALYTDVWVQLCRAAERTERIALGPGVTVPSLRHPMTTAAAIATLVDLAGAERVDGRHRLRVHRPHDVRPAPAPLARSSPTTCGRCKALLRGDEVEWEGAPIRMMQWPGFGPARPIDVPFVIAAGGPKGIAVAEELGDGVFGATPIPGFAWSTLLAYRDRARRRRGPRLRRVARRGRSRRRADDARGVRVRRHRRAAERPRSGSPPTTTSPRRPATSPSTTATCAASTTTTARSSPASCSPAPASPWTAPAWRDKLAARRRRRRHRRRLPARRPRRPARAGGVHGHGPRLTLRRPVRRSFGVIRRNASSSGAPGNRPRRGGAGRRGSGRARRSSPRGRRCARRTGPGRRAGPRSDRSNASGASKNSAPRTGAAAPSSMSSMSAIATARTGSPSRYASLASRNSRDAARPCAGSARGSRGGRLCPYIRRARRQTLTARSAERSTSAMIRIAATTWRRSDATGAWRASTL